MAGLDGLGDCVYSDKELKQHSTSRHTNNLADIWQPAGFEINTQTAQTDTRRAFLGSVMKSLCGESWRAAV